ncbi:MAG: hypothetical protein ACRDF5_11365 [bacterium]
MAPGVRGLRVSALLILGYAVSLAVNAGMYLSASGDRSELPRLALRLSGSMLLAYGLWNAARWAWWVAVFFTGFLAALGVPGLYVVATTGVLARRPYPAVDLVFFAVSLAALAGAFVTLILPATRQAVGVGRGGGGW